MNKKNSKKLLIMSFIILILISIDQTIKIYVLTNVYNTSKVLINGILNLTYIQNTGGAFGILENNAIIFIIVNIVVIGTLIRFILLKKEKISIITLASISLIIAGGTSNLIDRIFRGYVIDYIDINPLIKYPVFNFADICVVIGSFAILFSIIINRRNK